MVKCPTCGSNGSFGFTKFYCTNANCKNYDKLEFDKEPKWWENNPSQLPKYDGEPCKYESRSGNCNGCRRCEEMEYEDEDTNEES